MLSSVFKAKEEITANPIVDRITLQPQVTFKPSDFIQGQHQVVGNCNGHTMEERWETETPYFRDIILSQLNEGSTILDYGCGVGRIAKAILEVRPDLEIYGVDASPEMLKLAKEYVNSDRFITSSPIEFSGKVGFAYCAYVLQHIPSEYVEGAVKQISESTDRLLLVNSVGRMVATSQGFVNDGLDIFELTAKYFPKCRWAIPGEVLIDSKLMRKMFMGSPLAGTEGNTLHYAFIFEKA